jgi:dipeptidyl-peptidase-4
VLDLNKIFSAQGLVEPQVTGIKFSPDGKRLTFLKGKENAPKVYDLWEVKLDTLTQKMLVDSNDLTGGKEELSKEEKDRRERLRLFSSGIVSYEWSPSSESILFPVAGRLFLWESESDSIVSLNTEPTNLMDPKFSANGSYITYVEDQNVKYIKVSDKSVKSLTTEGKGDVRCGEAEFVVQEELSRFEGYWMSPNESILAFEKYDETPVEMVTRNEIFSDRVDIINQRYPYAGKDNVTYKIGFYHLETNETIYAKLDTDETYLARAHWNKSSSHLYIQQLNRLQSCVKLIRIDPKTGECETILEEESKPWININNIFRFSPDGSSFLWGSERNEFCHVFSYDLDGKLLKQLTSGDKQVVSINSYNENNLYFTAICDQGLNSAVYKLELDSLEETRLIEKDALSNAVVGNDQKFMVEIYNDVNTPQQVNLVNLDNQNVSSIHKSRCLIDGKIISEVLEAPEYGSLKSLDGKVDLNYRMILPHDFDKSKKYPAIVHLYGGPHAQMVTNGWAGDRYLFQQYLASMGFVVISLDNRGSANRGLSFEGAIYKNMGDLEVEDQLVAANHLKSLDFVDEDRIGVHGWSYGGYMTLMCMFKKPDVFKVGVSGAPVTDWSLYDTCYTERYMSTPQLNPEGYKSSSVFPYVKNLEGKLLVIHGMADDNVLFTNSTMLYSALHKEEKMFDIMLYPGEKHAVAGQVSKVHNYRTIANYFVENL